MSWPQQTMEEKMDGHAMQASRYLRWTKKEARQAECEIRHEDRS